ncbi:hypothetical protein DUNSADRAFT_17794 [Dunaliella salina]|uniref:Uncharacterized protein n=1 Tax=Dunaliella salina TaxID=3046 RepID=A0ABQ7G118_DUNSA|nr:hypothetical protein DUNSADRAFT_17794 [Dunaliella salina]|eukprot:KAF5828310.1 hypothetical protein DUNSADRAFT_17794 [Dunaliella salina]
MYDDKDVREAKNLERMKNEAEIRAKAWVKQQAQLRAGRDQAPMQGAEAGDSAAGNFGIEADVSASQDQYGGGKEGPRPGVRERREALATRKDDPVMHIEARHAQVEAQVRGMVEDALLARGVDAYNAYKYDEGA